MTILEAARRYVTAGFSVLPVRADGTKSPALNEWAYLQEHPPSPREISQWFAAGSEYGVGIIGGKVSHSLEIIDFDDVGIYQEFLALAAASGLSALVDRIRSGCEQASPRGVHLPYYCPDITGNEKLARRPATEEEMREDPKKIKTLIETRGEGGYVVAAPSSGNVHPSGIAYTILQGGWDSVATISPEERVELWHLCQTFDQMPLREEALQRESHSSRQTGDRPGDLFAVATAWADILSPAGWTWVYRRGEIDHWRRPGKSIGISATTNYAGSDLFYVFSSSTEFESERGYGKFSTYAHLHHNGDFHTASLALITKGYGRPREDIPFPDETDAPPPLQYQNGMNHYDARGNGAAPVEEAGQEADDRENARLSEQEREPIAVPSLQFPCPDILWQGRFAQVADRLNRRSWEIWMGTFCAMGAVAHKNLYWHYYRPLYGMVYGLLISPTGQGKGIVADVCQALLPEHYTIRDSVQSGPALFPILANIEKDQKGKILSIKPRPASLIIEEWTSLVKASKIEFSQLQETLNNLFHRSRPWNVSRSDTEKSGGDRAVDNPTLSICATTTESLLRNGVTPAMIRAGFLNRYFISPGSSETWHFYDPDQAGIDANLVKGFLDDLVATAWGNGANVWTAYTEEAREQLVAWGEQLFGPLMASQSIEAESLKRLHVYAHIICLLYAWSERAPYVLPRHVEAAIAVCTISKVFVEGLMTTSEVEIPKSKQYEMNLEEKIVEKVKRNPGITARKISQDLRKSGSLSDLTGTTGQLVKNGILKQEKSGKALILYSVEQK